MTELQTSARVIKVAAALADRYQYPAGAAYTRPRFADAFTFGMKQRNAPASARRNQFWFSVGRALTEAYDVRCGIRSDYGNAMRKAIDAERESMAH